MSRIGTMGHSRGGEGVVWNGIVDGSAPTRTGSTPCCALAPVDFTRATINEVPFAVMLPYCDGDVYDLQGVHFFDDSRYLVPGDASPKSTRHRVRRQPQLLQHGLVALGRVPGRLRRRSVDLREDRLTQRCRSGGSAPTSSELLPPVRRRRDLPRSDVDRRRHPGVDRPGSDARELPGARHTGPAPGRRPVRRVRTGSPSARRVAPYGPRDWVCTGGA